MMDELLILLGIAVAVLLVRVNRLRKQVARHEREIAGLLDAASSRPSSAVEAEEAVRPAAPPPVTAPGSDKLSAPDDSPSPASERVTKEPVGPGLLSRAALWVGGHWFYVVSAISLALAGLFLVQYGMENGLFPPVLRVLGALALGAGLIGAGEFIRRRSGDAPDANTAHLPSVFCSAGIVSMFGGVLSARLLYALIGAEVAIAGLVAIAALALVLGWVLGPLLSAIGLVGAFAAPFIVGGQSDETTLFYAYFTLIAGLGLGIDTLRRWAWISVLSVVLGFASTFMLLAFDPPSAPAYGLSICALAIMATLIPARGLKPDHAGAMLSQLPQRPIFPVWLSGGALAAASAGLVLASQRIEADFWLSAGLLTGLALLWTFWSARAPALQDQVLLPVAGLFVAVGLMADGTVAKAFDRAAQVPEGAFPLAVTALVALGVLITFGAAWRSAQGARFASLWAGFAALVAPALAVLLELTWAPAQAIGAYPWALHAAVLAALMTVLTLRFSADETRLRPALFALSALACIAFSLLLILSLAALTAALALTVLAAVILDRRFDLRPMGFFVAAGVVAIGYRLLADPGLDWALETSWPELALSHGTVLLCFLSGLSLLPPQRDEERLMLDSAAWSAGALSMSVVLWRVLENFTGFDGAFAHWTFGLLATVWIAAALAQFQRLEGRRALRWIRAGLGALFALIALAPLAAAVLLANPLLTGWGQDVAGAPVLNTLAVAYLLPALVLGAGALRLRALPVILRAMFGGLALALGALWGFAAIRHIWQGSGAMQLDLGMGQGELYTYTVALLLLGAGLFYQSLARNSALLRRAGLAVLGLAVAKVFFIDISGLGGLVRVLALLVLGLALAGLAWLDRWAQGRGGGAGPEDGTGGQPPDPRHI